MSPLNRAGRNRSDTGQSQISSGRARAEEVDHIFHKAGLNTTMVVNEGMASRSSSESLKEGGCSSIMWNGVLRADVHT